MNLFVVIGGKLLTPPLSDSILAGVTRDSVIQLARSQGLVVDERPVSIKEVRAAHQSGTLTEIFGTGTAAVISPVGELAFGGGEKLIVNQGKPGPISLSLFETISGIQRSTVVDPHGWMVPVK
jgi:branched-chain amino acid aminotransferase